MSGVRVSHRPPFSPYIFRCLSCLDCGTRTWWRFSCVRIAQDPLLPHNCDAHLRSGAAVDLPCLLYADVVFAVRDKSWRCAGARMSRKLFFLKGFQDSCRAREFAFGLSETAGYPHLSRALWHLPVTVLVGFRKNDMFRASGRLTSPLSRRTSAPLHGNTLLPHEAGVAQLVRVPACHAGGRGFEPRHSRHSPQDTRYRLGDVARYRECAGVAQLVRVPACHAGGRGFEPRHSRHSRFPSSVISSHRISPLKDVRRSSAAHRSLTCCSADPVLIRKPRADW